MCAGYCSDSDLEVLMEDVLTVSLDIVDAMPGVIAAGMAVSCLVVSAAGALVGGFKALISLIGR